MRKFPLKLRLTLWYTVLMVCVSAVVLTVVTSFGKNMIDRDAKERLVGAVNGMEMQMRGRGGGYPERMPDDALRRGGRMRFYEQGVHMVLLDEDKNVIEGQIPFSITDELDLEPGSVRKKSYDGNRYLVYDREVTLHSGERAYIKGFISIEEGSYALATVQRNNLYITIVMILIAAIGGWFITRRALLPVSVINKTARSIIKSKDLSQRINAKATDEIGELANTLDEMLSEIQYTLEREQQFTSDASHELRTPIAVIFSECEYMTDCAETVDELKNSAMYIKEEAQKMSTLVSELLTISRMDKDILKLNYEEVDLSDLVNFVASEQELINESSIALLRKIEPNITVMADKFLIARLFINLISNAYRYNKENGTITVSLCEKGENIVFSVEDTGIGISKDDTAKIWERFYQVDPSRTQHDGGGIGLGLSMVRWIAEKHGGEVSVTSVLGEGSTFTFTMPKDNKMQN